MGNLLGNIVTAVVMLMFFAFCLAATRFSVRHLMKVMRSRSFPHWDGRIVRLADAPVSGGLYLLRVVAALLAALAAAALPIWMVVNTR